MKTRTARIGFRADPSLKERLTAVRLRMENVPGESEFVRRAVIFYIEKVEKDGEVVTKLSPLPEVKARARKNADRAQGRTP
jgi:hypothetical protein